MHRVCLLILLAVATTANAASWNSRLQFAQTLLQSGQAAEALEAFNELQVEDPENTSVQFGIAASHYQMGEHHATQGVAEAASEAFTEAEQHFDRLSRSEDARISEHSAFNRANCLAEKAKLSAGDPALAQAAVGAYKAAAEAYDQVLAQWPENRPAEQNRDHVRYALKVLQQQMEEQQQEQEQQPEQQPQQAFVMLQSATTQIKDADAKTNEAGDTVTLEYGGKGQP